MKTKFNFVKLVMALMAVTWVPAVAIGCAPGPVEETVEPAALPVSINADPRAKVMASPVGLQGDPADVDYVSSIHAPAGSAAENTDPAAAYEAGALLRGSNHALYYVTGAGTRQFIYDADTFSAFGFRLRDVIDVDDDVLAAMPMTDVLTRLVRDDRDNLYWVVDGQRWQVNTWKDVVDGPGYSGEPVCRLDGSLEEALPIKVGLRNRTFLRQDDEVYYFNQYTIVLLEDGSYDDAEVIDVPPDVLTVYPRRATMQTLWTELKDIPAAYVRGGPGTDFKVIDTVYQGDGISVKGRARGSYWLQIKYRGQEGWLAGDLVKHQSLIKFLPTIDTSALEPDKAETKQEETEDSNTYEGIGVYVSTNADGLPFFTGVMKGYPADMAGMKEGDVVTMIDGEDAAKLYDPGTTMHIRGPKGTVIVLTIFRPSTGETLEFAIIRDVINPDTATYACGTEPIRGFGNTWREHPEIQDLLGCPYTNFRRNEHATRAAVQTFEHGWMLWLETDTVANVDPIYVFFEDDDSFIRYGERALVDAHGYAPTPTGFYKVGDRFAKVYWEEIGEDGRQRLGYAINEARDSLGAFQEFRNGRMFWAGEADTIYIIYRGYLDMDGDGRTSWTQAWTSFEDTFEDTP